MPKREETMVDVILKEDFSKLPKADQLYREFLGETNIEKTKEEDFAIDQLMRGRTKTSIIQDLNLKHPEYNFTMKDINKFLERNTEIVKELEKRTNALARRHLNAKTKIEEELAQLFMFTKELVKKYDSQNDNQSTIAALRTAMDMMLNYSKLAGFYGGESSSSGGPQNVIQIITDSKSDIARKTVSANFKMVDMNEEDINKPKEQVKDEKTNSK